MSNKRVINMIVDRNNGILTPISIEEFKNLIGYFDHNLTVTVTVEPFVRDATLSQKNLFHKYVSLASQETGQDFPSVKTEMKRLFGARNENGLVKSVNDHTSVEMGKLIDGTHLFMTQQLGMNLPTPEEWSKKNFK